MKRGHVIARSKSSTEFFSSSGSYERPVWTSLEEASVFHSPESAESAVKKLWVRGHFASKVKTVEEMNMSFELPTQSPVQVPASSPAPAAPVEDDLLDDQDEITISHADDCGCDQCVGDAEFGDQEDVDGEAVTSTSDEFDDGDVSSTDDAEVIDVDGVDDDAELDGSEIGSALGKRLSTESLSLVDMDDRAPRARAVERDYVRGVESKQAEKDANRKWYVKVAGRVVKGPFLSKAGADQVIDSKYAKMGVEATAVFESVVGIDDVTGQSDQKVKIPAGCMSELTAAIAQHKRLADQHNNRDTAIASFHLQARDALEEIHDAMKDGTVEAIKAIQVKMSSWMSPLIQTVPEATRKFILSGGNRPSLKSMFDDMKSAKKDNK